MAKKRLIPKLLLKKGGYQNSQNVVVRSRNFEVFFEIGDVVSQSKIFQDQIADELIILKIDKGISFKTLCSIINSVSKEIFMPLTVGGGINSVEKISKLLANGADKVCLNTNAYLKPELISEAVKIYGSSTIVVSIDFKVNALGKETIYINNGKNSVDLNLKEWVKKIEDLGAGEIHLNSINRDGMKNGLEIVLGEKIEKMCGLPIVLSGGCGLAEHFSEGFIATNVSGIAAGTFFAQQDQNFIQTRAQIRNSNIDIR